ncbi:MAG: hypothetical protein QHH74_09910 [Spirochaetota bacterium]|nr:hypothetical protein [Spirochaetota bacterium]
MSGRIIRWDYGECILFENNIRSQLSIQLLSLNITIHKIPHYNE